MIRDLFKRELGPLVRTGALQFVFADGAVLDLGDGGEPRVTARFADRWAPWALLLDPDLQTGELFADGRLVIEEGSVYDFLQLVLRHAGGAEPSASAKALEHLRTTWRRWTGANGRARARRNVAHHYDLDDRLYALFLDSEWQYSCAYFEHPAMTLAEAQRAKMRHIAAKLALSGVERVLDIGCGWGGLACYLAEAAGAGSVLGVTLSSEQIARTRGRILARGLSRRVEVALRDFRDVDGAFDRIVSVGMFEHVGLAHYDAFFQQPAGGRGGDALHTIGVSDAPSLTNPWITKHIFPGGHLPALSEILPAIERAGLVVTDVEVLRLHYAHTLRAWREAFLARARCLSLNGDAQRAMNRTSGSWSEVNVRSWRSADLTYAAKTTGIAVPHPSHSRLRSINAGPFAFERSRRLDGWRACPPGPCAGPRQIRGRASCGVLRRQSGAPLPLSSSTDRREPNLTPSGGRSIPSFSEEGICVRIQSIPLSWARRHCANAVREGLSLECLFERALIDPRFDDDRDRISSAQLALLYYHANQATEDEGRRNSAAKIPIGFGTLAARALFGHSTLEGGLGAMAHLSNLTSSALRIAVRTDHDEARLVVYCEDGRDGADTVSLEDAYLSFLFMCVSHFLGGPMPLLRFQTRDPLHMNIGQAQWATGAPTGLASVSALVFPRALLAARRVPDPQDEIFCDIFQPWMRFVDRGAAFALDDLPPAQMRVGDIARATGVSPATARRRMDAMDGGFRRRRSEALVAAGVALLQDSGASVDAIAVELGYADARSFRRFLKGETGKTPDEWRREATAGPNTGVAAAVHARVLDFARELDGQLRAVPVFNGV